MRSYIDDIGFVEKMNVTKDVRLRKDQARARARAQ